MPITGDVWEYFQILKDSLLEEVEHQVEEDDETHYALKRAMTMFWDMFAKGSTDYSSQCHVCKTLRTLEQPFTELILYFEDKHHHTNKKKSNACTLDELLDTYNSREDIVDDYACSICNRRTRATVRNRVRQYPRVLCIAISRGAYSENKTGLVQTLLNFPIDTFKPKKYSLFQDDADDIANFPDGGVDDNTAYDLIAEINRYPNRTDGGHFTAICKQHCSGVWYSYDDQDVKTSKFSKSVKGVPTVRTDFQRHVALLFYIRQEPTQVDASIVTGVDGNNDGSTNSTRNSRTSKFSDFANADITSQSIALNDNDKEDDSHIEGNITTALNRDKVCESVFSAPIILFHIVVHFSYINVLQP